MNVSVMTVSLALRGHPKIPAARRAEIQQVATQMGYRPNPNAAALAYQRRHSMEHPICAGLAWINRWQEPGRLRGYKEFDLYWRGALEAAERNGFGLEEFVVGPELSFSRLEKILQARNIQGILVPPHGGMAGTEPDRLSLDWSRYSVVRFGYSLLDFPAHVVAGNHIQGTLLACDKIRERGYRRIGYTCFDGSSMRGKAGVFLFQMNLPEEERLPVHVIERGASRKVNLQRLDAWIRENRPDAIFSEVAELRGMLADLGHEVPRDIGLAATSVLDGNADAGIHQNSEEVGRAAIETLIELMYRNETGLPKLAREVLVDGGWQEGGTLPAKVRAPQPPSSQLAPAV
ncbi:MAG: LacI family DNA-binding transcriptional regulator [Verrucomicrobia bacterium]|nr:LacI family DNA-binding transcriptional regulator [Verrucomicrobiota bacterium]